MSRVVWALLMLAIGYMLGLVMLSHIGFSIDGYEAAGACRKLTGR